MEDWRLDGQEEFLMNKKLAWVKFEEKLYGDHDHCDFCWLKFSEEATDLHYGYLTYIKVGPRRNITQAAWICEECYNDFKEMFHWTLENSDEQIKNETDTD